MTDRSIQPVEPADAAAVGELIARAFAALPAAVWLAADPTERVRMLAGQFAILVEHALAYGTVHWTGDRRGVAVWFDRTVPAPEPPDYPRRLAAICGEATPRFETLDGLFEQHHPGDPHHHLALLAVDPAHQGHGLGTALLAHHHTQLDARGVPAYLEASSERNRRLYGRHGYRAGTPFHLPDGPPFWPMWRPPKGT
jgi:ribosomal protein S18 acetylase RimI-like enzyme